jgi:hypothetical protein
MNGGNDSYEQRGKEPLMNSLALKILLTVYILYALLKFFEFFFRDEETKMKGLYTVYVKGGGAVVKIFDNVMCWIARQRAFACGPGSPRTDALGNFQSSLRDWSRWELCTQHCVLGYSQPSLRD